MTLSDKAPRRPSRITASVLVALLIALIWLICPGIALPGLVSILVLGAFWAMSMTTDCLVLRRMTIPGLFFWVYMLTVLPPCLAVYNEQAQPYREWFLFAVLSVLVTVPLGVWLANTIAQFRPIEIASYYEAPVVSDARQGLPYRGAVVLFLAAICLTAAYIFEAGRLPILSLISNTANLSSLSMEREESLKLLDSPLRYWYGVLRTAIYPFLVVVTHQCFLYRHSRKWAFLFSFSLLAAILYASLTAAKSPVGLIIIFLAFSYYLHRHGQIRKRVAIMVLLGSLSFPVFVSSRQFDIGFVDVITGFGDRLFQLPATILFTYFEVFPAYEPFKGGATIEKFARLTGKEPFDDSNFVGQYLTGSQSSMTANTTFISGLYADFGQPGVVIGGVCAGAIMQLFQIVLIRRPKTSLNLSLYAFLLPGFAMLTITNLPIVLMSGGVLIVFVLDFLIRRLDGFLSFSAAGQLPVEVSK